MNTYILYKKKWFSVSAANQLALVLSLCLIVSCTKSASTVSSSENLPKPINPLSHQASPHLDHKAFFKKEVQTPQQITQACLKCHPKAADEVMKTAHWTWISGDVERKGKQVLIGKRNQMNNFCISVIGNWNSCTACHAGYGWTDDKFDFSKKENVDCLICHEGTGTYSKGKGGMPKPGIDLLAVAGSVRNPKRENCGACHFNGGGGMGVKHGDLDESLINPNEQTDVHMGRLNFQCVDCHKTKAHFIPGKINATFSAATHFEKMDCQSCHINSPHADSQLNKHISKVACQTCHVPNYARKLPTKMYWDWSQAGSDKRKDNVHEYLKIKGSFKYEEDVIPEYAWFNGKMDRYVTGDKITSLVEQPINQPMGNRNDPEAKIWPFKVHRGKQIYDPVNLILLPPVTSGEGGYWSKFDWDFAVRKGAELAELPFSGKYGFTATRMYWPINHMVTPKKMALQCIDCHSEKSRLDWKMLGYEKDPTKGTVKNNEKK